MSQTIKNLLALALLFTACAVSSVSAMGIFYDAEAQEDPLTADEGSVEDALNFIRNGRIDRGTIILQRLAGEGNSDSLFHLAELYRLGIGREKANNVATMYYRLATALGHETASLSLANMLFFEGDGSDKTISEALSVWRNLAIEGNAESIYMLGMVYWNGEAGQDRDPIRGYGLVWRAAQSGYADAVQNELTMHSLLNAEARDAAIEFGKSISDASFGDEVLAAELLTVALPEGKTETSSEDTETSFAAAAADPQTLTSDETNEAEQSKDAAVTEAVEPAAAPEDWSSVWRLEVGFAMSKLDVGRLQSVISASQAAAVGNLSSEIAPSATRPGLYRLVYGPMKGLNQAVNVCVILKRAGHDCSAKAPEEQD